MNSYPPLSDVRQSLRVKWYRSPIDKQRLRELSERTDRQGWIQTGGHLGAFLLTGTITLISWQQQIWSLFFIALWCHGFIATFFKGTAAHELGHGTVFKTKALNRFFLYLVSLISWWDPFDYASSHTYHHRYTTHIDADRENILPLQPSLHPRVLLEMFTLHLFLKPERNFSKGGFFWNLFFTTRSALGIAASHTHIPNQEWLQALHEDDPTNFRNSIWWSRFLLLFHGSVLGLAIVTGWWVLPLLISLPSFIANIGAHFIGTTQHCGLQESVPDFRKNTRSIKLNPVMRFFYWHMNWHTEHHMYAGVPCYNLKALAEELKQDMPEPRSLVGAWKEMRSTWKRQQTEPDYYFDTPVPESLGQTDSGLPESMINSIGDLAPAKLK